MVKGANFVKTYLVSLGLFGCLIVLFVSWAFYYNSNELIHDRLLHRSRAFFQEILLTRQWIAGHNGVYVKLGPGTVVNPYLLQVPGLKVVITDESGQMYTLKNPALVTREISELAEKEGCSGSISPASSRLTLLTHQTRSKGKHCKNLQTGVRKLLPSSQTTMKFFFATWLRSSRKNPV